MQPENSADRINSDLANDNELNDEDIITAEIADEPSAPNDNSRRSFIEQLLSPQTLQWMMACGSGLLM